VKKGIIEQKTRKRIGEGNTMAIYRLPYLPGVGEKKKREKREVKKKGGKASTYGKGKGKTGANWK